MSLFAVCSCDHVLFACMVTCIAVMVRTGGWRCVQASDVTQTRSHGDGHFLEEILCKFHAYLHVNVGYSDSWYIGYSYCPHSINFSFQWTCFSPLAAVKFDSQGEFDIFSLSPAKNKYSRLLTLQHEEGEKDEWPLYVRQERLERTLLVKKKRKRTEKRSIPRCINFNMRENF